MTVQYSTDKLTTTDYNPRHNRVLKLSSKGLTRQFFIERVKA